MTLGVEELNGMSHKKIGLKVERFVNKCEGTFPDEADRNWMPEKWQALKKGLKIWRFVK